MGKPIIKIIESSYEPVNEFGEGKSVPYLGLNEINLSDFFCDSREEQLFKKSGQLLEHRTYNGDYELSTMKLLVYNENDLLVKEINTCIIPDWDDIGTDYIEDSFEKGKKLKSFFHQSNSEQVNDGYIEYVYSNDYSKIIDASQSNGSYQKLSENNIVKIIEKWGNNGTESLMLEGVLDEINSNNEVVFSAIFDDNYNIPSQKGYKNYFENGYHIQEWATGEQINYRKCDVNNNLVEERTLHRDFPNHCRKILYRYNEFNDEIECEIQSFNTEDENGNKLSDKPVNIYTHNGGNPNITMHYYLYDNENNWIRKVSVYENKIISVTEREIEYL